MENQTKLQEKLDRLQNELIDIKKILLEVQADKRSIVKDCYSEEEVAKMVGVKVRTVREDVKMGFIKKKYPNAVKCFHRDAVEPYLRGCKRKKVKIK